MFRSSGCLIAVLVFTNLVHQSAGQIVAVDAYMSFKGHADTSGWTVHSETGRIFASIKTTAEVIEYNNVDGREVRRFAVGDEPVEMIIKGDTLVVACAGSSSLSLIDLNENKVAGDIKLPGHGLGALVLHVEHRDPRAVPGQQCRGGATDPRGSPGHHRRASGELHRARLHAA